MIDQVPELLCIDCEHDLGDIPIGVRVACDKCGRPQRRTSQNELVEEPWSANEWATSCVSDPDGCSDSEALLATALLELQATCVHQQRSDTTCHGPECRCMECDDELAHDRDTLPPTIPQVTPHEYTTETRSPRRSRK